MRWPSLFFDKPSVSNITRQHCILLPSYLLNAQPLESSEAAGCQLVSIVTNTQLTVTIIAPAINLEKQKKKYPLHFKFRFLTGILRVSCKAIFTSPFSITAIEEVCPHVMPTEVLPCRQPVTFLG